MNRKYQPRPADSHASGRHQDLAGQSYSEEPMIPVELVVDARAAVGEGPVWDERTRKLVWVDIPGCAVHHYDPATGADMAIDLGDRMPGCILIRDSGGYAVGAQHGFFAMADSNLLTQICEIEADDPVNRMNDGKCDRAGRIWAGTMAHAENIPGSGNFYRIDPDHSVTKILDGITISNGTDWSLDNSLMYYIDSPTQNIDVFDFDPASGVAANRQPLVQIEEGIWPDGLTVDAAGNIWLALFGGSAVRCYSPEGKLQEVIELPTANITSVAFGGDDYMDLYITSAANKLSSSELDAQTGPGGLFVCRPGVRGQPAATFAG